MCEADTLFMIECVHSYECLWNVSVADYHKKEARHAALCSISIHLAEDRQKILTGELKFCFSSCCLHFTMFTDSDTESGSASVVLRSVYNHVAVLVLVLYVRQRLYGSVLGPFLFCLYTTSISQMINTHDVSHHMYADDTQVYIELSQSDTHKSISSLSDCLTDISLWMKSSKLKLNSNKTEFIIIGTKQQRHKLSNHFPVKLIDNDISPSDSVRNLGVIFDSDFSFHKHISNICKSCFYHIRDLRRIRRHLPLSTAKTISNSLITSRLDYCNSLINNIAKQDLSKLQRVQNCLARVVLRAPRFSPSLPLLKQLHWLPVNYRIKFKLSTLTYRALAIHQPPYLASLLHFSNVPRQLTSSTSQQLSIPRTKLNLGKRAFSVAAPIIWNELPTTLKSCESLASFRKNLKTYLFKIAFPP